MRLIFTTIFLFLTACQQNDAVQKSCETYYRIHDGRGYSTNVETYRISSDGCAVTPDGAITWCGTFKILRQNTCDK